MVWWTETKVNKEQTKYCFVFRKVSTSENLTCVRGKKNALRFYLFFPSFFCRIRYPLQSQDKVNMCAWWIMNDWYSKIHYYIKCLQEKIECIFLLNLYTHKVLVHLYPIDKKKWYFLLFSLSVHLSIWTLTNDVLLSFIHHRV